MCVFLGHRAAFYVLPALIIAALMPSRAFASSRSEYCQYSDRHEVLYVDLTTPMLDLDRQNLVSTIEHMEDSLFPGERLTIRTITDQFTTSSQIFSECLPGCPLTGWMGWLTSKCSAVVARSRKIDFDTDLATKARFLIQQHNSLPRSDILRTITFTTDKDIPSKTEYFFFSDMLENSDLIHGSMIYRLDPSRNFKLVQKYGMVPPLKGARIRIVEFGTLDDDSRKALTTVQINRVETFWRLVFGEAGSTIDEIGHSGD